MAALAPPAPDPSRDERVSNNYYIVARLKPGVTAARAQAEMDAINHGLAEQHSEDRGLGVKVSGWQQQVGGEVRPALLILIVVFLFHQQGKRQEARGGARKRGEAKES